MGSTDKNRLGRLWLRRWLWFVALYLTSLLIYAAVTSLLHLIIWR